MTEEQEKILMGPAYIYEPDKHNSEECKKALMAMVYASEQLALFLGKHATIYINDEDNFDLGYSCQNATKALAEIHSMIVLLYRMTGL